MLACWHFLISTKLKVQLRLLTNVIELLTHGYLH